MDKTVFIINGGAKVGKDTIVSMVKKMCNTRNIDSVAVIKNVAIQLGWDGTKTEKNRLFLSELKRLADNHFNHSTKYISNQLKLFIDSEDVLSFVHIREPQMIDKAKELCSINNIKCYTMIVTNPNIPQITTNQSDKNVFNYKYDIHICNDGTLEDLRYEVETIIGGYLV